MIRISFLIIFLLFCQKSFANDTFLDIRRLRMEPVFGTVEYTGRNTINIYDEQEKRSKQIIYVGNTQSFQKGDRIRVDYDSRGFVISVRKMSRVEYKKEGQNAGFILKQ